jgi:hypothetical protein
VREDACRRLGFTDVLSAKGIYVGWRRGWCEGALSWRELAPMDVQDRRQCARECAGLVELLLGSSGGGELTVGGGRSRVGA